MKQSLINKLEKLQVRQADIHRALSTPEVIANQNKFRVLSQEAAGIAPIVECFGDYLGNVKNKEAALAMQKDKDKELQALATEELVLAEERQAELELQLQVLLVPKDPADEGNVFLEIRAGTGGEEAALFASSLVRMYSRYAETKGWKIEHISMAESDLSGYKEIIMRVIGKGAYSKLKFESGVHRVQRVPETESQGRVHTSACTVAVLPEVGEVNDIEVNPTDLRIDTYRASGAGGQHVNKTDSAIRITHLPSGTVVECQDERSQHKNRARAMSLLKAKLLEEERIKQRAQQAKQRRDLVGSGDRSERIRTYNFSQRRVTDHRVNLTLYQLDIILDGALDPVIDVLATEHQADLMMTLAED